MNMLKKEIHDRNGLLPVWRLLVLLVRLKPCINPDGLGQC